MKQNTKICFCEKTQKHTNFVKIEITNFLLSIVKQSNRLSKHATTKRNQIEQGY